MCNCTNTCRQDYCGYYLSAGYFLFIVVLTVPGMGTSEILDLIYRKISRIDGNGIVTLFGIFIATIYVRRQVNQANIQVRQTNEQLNKANIQLRLENRQSRQNKLESHAVAASRNICFHNIIEGYFYEAEVESARYISAWRVDKRRNNNNNEISYHFNFLFRSLDNGMEFDHAFQYLCDVNNYNRWDYQLLIPKIGESYGSMSGISRAGGIEKMDYGEYQLILRAMKKIQLYNYEDMLKCQNNLIHSEMKFANDKLLDEGVFKNRGSRS